MPSKTYREALKWGESLLCAAEIDDAAFDARSLMEQASGVRRAELLMLYGEKMPESKLELFEGFVSRRVAGEPLQYILGEWDFMGYTFGVEPGVLIPRPETEFLVEKAVSLLPKNSVLYDVCAGSGCIGISVALERPDVSVFLFEKYPTPFRCLSENKQRLSAQNVTTVQCDMLLGIPEGLPKPHGIVSNPPYICTAELSTLQKEVQREPMEALDGGEDGDVFYRALHDLWFPSLQNGGFLSMECGEAQPQRVAKLFSGRTEVEDDFYGVERFVTAYQS